MKKTTKSGTGTHRPQTEGFGRPSNHADVTGHVPRHPSWPHNHGQTTSFVVGPGGSSQIFWLENTKLGKTEPITAVRRVVARCSEVKSMCRNRFPVSERVPCHQVSLGVHGKVPCHGGGKGKSAHWRVIKTVWKTN